MEASMRVNYETICDMVAAFTIIKIMTYTLENGKMIYFMAKVVIYLAQLKDIRDSLKKGKKKDSVSTNI